MYDEQQGPERDKIVREFTRYAMPTALPGAIAAPRASLLFRHSTQSMTVRTSSNI